MFVGIEFGQRLFGVNPANRMLAVKHGGGPDEAVAYHSRDLVLLAPGEVEKISGHRTALGNIAAGKIINPLAI